MTVHRVEIEGRPEFGDALGEAVLGRLASWLDLRATRVRTRKVFLLDLGLNDEEAQWVAAALSDEVAERHGLGRLADEGESAGVVEVEVGFLPGVTDTVGKSAKRAAEDRLGRKLAGHVYFARQYLIAGLTTAQAQRAADELLHNPMIERAHVGPYDPAAPPRLAVPAAGDSAPATVNDVPLLDATDEELQRISDAGTLALSLAEMKAIQAHFKARGREPHDAELECLAQTWSEHCKHKIFASPIRYVDPQGETHELERGLFRSYVRGATEAVAQAREAEGVDAQSGGPFLVSVFHDNAGVVRFTERDHLVYKVETHNSPSALDPYGGAMTGIVGVNRDSFGTGLGADLLTNVWGYCFGDPRYEGQLPKGLMHPRRIRDGVHEGVIDGGNHSGIPYSRGFERFDDRYAGKPLVYCGTVAVMPVESAGQPTHEKRCKVGDHIVMVGGRIGKDGIHGATFSSAQLDESAPVQAVQIGDPITQKMMWDMLTEARERGLYSSFTDNGAGGLSSSIGEMAEATNGAELDLAKAPLKYPGLQPWEILISEAQERMSLAVPPEKLEAFMALAEKREVEATVLGTFTDSGRFVVRYGDQEVCDLPMDFLHEGVPLPVLEATWSPPERAFDPTPALDLRDDLLAMLARPNLTSNEERARHYDHEVKGLSVVKPFVGATHQVPSTATVMRARHGRPEGVVLAEGIHPFLSDLDTDAMAKASVDEGVRRVLCAGARWDRLSALDNFCWPDPIVSSKTPDGAHKLAQLVRCCQGLDEACRTYGVPLISGKDSMKNDAYLDGVKISIPPTLLVSVMGQTADVTKSLTLEARAVGDKVFVLGGALAAEELGASEWARHKGVWLDGVPQTDLADNAERYAVFDAARDAGEIKSAHAPGLGGLAVALAHIAMASEHSLSVELDGEAGLSESALAFAESTGRIVLTADAQGAEKLKARFGDKLFEVGQVTPAGPTGPAMTLRVGQQTATFTRAELLESFTGGLRGL